jgi:hypothetical protein
MENNTGHEHSIPPDCFSLEEIQILQSYEQQRLERVTYYVWHNQAKPGALPHRFLYAIELVFDSGESLLLSSGEDSEAICLITAEQLVDTAHRLQQLHGKAVIQRILAQEQPLWRDVSGKTLQNIRLAKNDEGWYLNDAVLLDFNEYRVLVRLAEREGLLAGAY